MKSFSSNKFPEVIRINPDVYSDNRGQFSEIYKKDGYPEFVQDNISASKKNVFRGLHFQLAPFPQGKLVTCYTGAVVDFVVDIRPNSPTFGKWDSFILIGAEKAQVWIPSGFAHGFYSYAEESIIIAYKLTNEYHKDLERTLFWKDPEVNINWKLFFNPEDVIMSEKDKRGRLLEELLPELEESFG